MSVSIKLQLNQEIINIDLERPEFIFGITAVLYNGDTNGIQSIYVPILEERVTIIKSNETRFFIPAHIQEDFIYAKKNNLLIKQVIAPYFKGIGNENVREDVKTQERHSVIVVIKNDKSDEYLCLDCKNRDCKSFVLGGVEEGETVEEAAIREVYEETGYNDIEITYKSPFKLINHFYAEYKEVNRYATMEIIIGRLKSESNTNISEEENKKHIIKWVHEEELLNFLTVNNNIYAVDLLFNGEKAIINEGVMINSSFLDRLDSYEAREKVEKLLKS